MNEQKEIEILKLAHQRYSTLSGKLTDQKNYFVDMIKFAYNIEEGQWDAEDITIREKQKRPYLTSNKCSKYVAQVVNEERTQDNSSHVIPVDERGDKAIASVLQDIIDDIEYQSNAPEIYQNSGEYAVAGGFGYWQILTRMMPHGFDQEVYLRHIKNPLSVSLDEDRNYGFIRDKMTKEAFHQKWPKARQESWEDVGNDDNEHWYDEDNVYIADYYCKEETTIELAEIIHPVTGEIDIIEVPPELSDKIGKKYQVLRRREEKTCKVMWYKITGSQILEYTEWVGDSIPIIEVVGKKVCLQGKTYRLSLIHDAVDDNRLYNFYLTAGVEQTQLQIKAPYLVTQQQIRGYENIWANANDFGLPYLYYNPTNMGKPSKEAGNNLDSSTMNMLNLSQSNISDSLGMYGPAIGQPSNERSGKAITARKASSDMGVFNFPDNLSRAKFETRKQLLDIIPKIYNTARIIRLRGKDEVISINFPELVNGQETLINDLSMGRYDIRQEQTTSPSRRQQEVDNILQLAQYAPNFADVLVPAALAVSDAKGLEKIKPAIQSRQQLLQLQTEVQVLQLELQKAQLTTAIASTQQGEQNVGTGNPGAGTQGGVPAGNIG